MRDCDCVPGHQCDCWDYRAEAAQQRGGLDVERLATAMWEVLYPGEGAREATAQAEQIAAAYSGQPQPALREAAEYALAFMADPEGLAHKRDEWRARLHDALAQPQPALSPEAVPEVPSEPPDREPLSCLDGAWPCKDRFHQRHVLKRGVFGGYHTTPDEYGADEWEPAEPEREATPPPTVKRAEGTSFGEAGATPFGKAGDTSVTPSGNPLDVAWREVADAVVDRPYPGTDINGGWYIQLFGYPPTSIGGTPETRYHAMATPAIDSHHRNTVKATGPTPSAALQALLTALSSQSPVGAERTPTATSGE